MRPASWRYLVVALVPLIACGATWPLMDADRWSGLGQWVGGIGTLWAVLFALHTFTAERSKAESERLDREMTQARLVTAHLDVPPPQVSRLVPISVVMANHSSSPIFDLQFGGPAPLGKRGELSFVWGYASEEVDEAIPPTVLPAGATHEISFWFHPDGQPEFGGPRRRPIGDPMPQPVISFTDAEGRRWRRIGAGTPERLLPSPTTR